ncbi:MAG: HAMP domain-containing histidine kinase [Acidimicrobiia bacterium]|nr:HAMP domain-containing histidine kinase [Acidimicrobiia bacterium]
MAAIIETNSATEATPRSTRSVRRTASARVRILGWYVSLLAIALVGTFIVQRSYLIDREHASIDGALDQEVGEFTQLASGIDPATGEPFGTDLAALFDTFLTRNVAHPDEAVVTILDGTPYKADILGASLAAAPIVDEWVNVTEPVRGDTASAPGPIRYLAIPMLFGGEVRGVFVVAILKADRLEAVDEAVRIGALVAGSIFLLASGVAWFAAGAILKPLRSLRETAQSITDTDLTRRIPVEGDDEIADLGRTFNSMLDRVEAGFGAQRRFIDDAGHELRTPITIIRGHLELMGDDPEERVETVELVTDELDRMARIVDDLLDLAKAEQTDFVQTSPVNLGDFTRDLAHKAAALGERPWVVEEAADTVIHADRHRLNQAAMNLMRNALEHTPASAATWIGSSTENGTARLWVRDDGPGIPIEEQSRLFDRFARGKVGRRTTGGAGLGLAIVKAIAEAHQGRVTVDSAPGQGTVVTISLPIGPKHAGQEAS